MDAHAPPNQADRRSPPRKAGDPPLLDEHDGLPSSGAGQVPHEPDETSLGSWLQGFFLQSPPPPATRSLPPGMPSGQDSSSADTAAFDLADAVDEVWPRPAYGRIDITRGELPDRPPQPTRPPLHPLHRKIRRLLRDHISAADLARIVAMVVLLLAGGGLILATALRYVTHISPSGAARAPWQVPLLLAANALFWILGLTVPSLVMIKLIADLPWFRVGFYFSIIWFLAGLALFL